MWTYITSTSRAVMTLAVPSIRALALQLTFFCLLSFLWCLYLLHLMPYHHEPVVSTSALKQRSLLFENSTSLFFPSASSAMPIPEPSSLPATTAHLHSDTLSSGSIAPPSPSVSLTPSPAFLKTSSQDRTETEAENEEESGEDNGEDSESDNISEEPEDTEPEVLTVNGNAIAVAITSFSHIACLKFSLEQLGSLYPTIPIFVATFGEVSTPQLDCKVDVRYHRLHRNTRAGEARNLLVSLIRDAGFKYVLMLDDDTYLDLSFNLDRLLKILLKREADIVGVELCDFNPRTPFKKPRPGKRWSLVNTMRLQCIRRSDASFSMKDTGIIMEPHVSRYGARQYGFDADASMDGCYRTDLVHQGFLARVDSLASSRWDNSLDAYNHYDFFLNARHNGLRVFVCQRMQVWRFDQFCPTLDSAKIDWSQGVHLPRILSKWNIQWILDESGKNLTMQDSHGVIIPPNREQIFPYDSSGKTSGSTISSTLHLEGLMRTAINYPLSGWDQITMFDWQEVHQVPLGPCLRVISARASVRFERPGKSLVSKKVGMESSVTVSVPANDLSECDLVTKLGEVRLLRTLRTAPKNDPIEFVVAHKGLVEFLQRLVNQLDNMAQNYKYQSIHLTVADFATSDDKVIQVLQGRRSLQWELVTLEGDFSRTVGLSTAIEAVRRRRQESGATIEEAIIFAIDTSIVFSSTLLPEMIRRYVNCNHTAFLPIVRKWYNAKTAQISLEKTPESVPRAYVGWATSGYGMVGMCLGDYYRSGGYDTRWGSRWGVEDVDLAERLQLRAGVQLVRPYFEGMLHSERKPSVGEKKSRGSNVYHRKLPNIPHATEVKQSSMFIESALREHLNRLEISKDDQLGQIALMLNSSSITTSQVLYWHDRASPKSWFLFTITSSAPSEQYILLLQTALSSYHWSFQAIFYEKDKSGQTWAQLSHSDRLEWIKKFTQPPERKKSTSPSKKPEVSDGNKKRP